MKNCLKNSQSTVLQLFENSPKNKIVSWKIINGHLSYQLILKTILIFNLKRSTNKITQTNTYLNLNKISYDKQVNILNMYMHLIHILYLILYSN